jgi:hypothetical protein
MRLLLVQHCTVRMQQSARKKNISIYMYNSYKVAKDILFIHVPQYTKIGRLDSVFSSLPSMVLGIVLFISMHASFTIYYTCGCCVGARWKVFRVAGKKNQTFCVFLPITSIKAQNLAFSSCTLCISLSTNERKKAVANRTYECLFDCYEVGSMTRIALSRCEHPRT